MGGRTPRLPSNALAEGRGWRGSRRVQRGGRELGARGPSIASEAPGERPVGRRRASRPLDSPRRRGFESRRPGWGVFVSEEDLRDRDGWVASPQRPRSLSFLPPYLFITSLLPLTLRISLCGFPGLVLTLFCMGSGRWREAPQTPLRPQRHPSNSQQVLADPLQTKQSWGVGEAIMRLWWDWDWGCLPAAPPGG